MSSTVHVRQIIDKYKSGEPLLYNKLVDLCRRLNSDVYREAAVVDFLSQCLQVVDYLVEDESAMTEALLGVKWHRVSAAGVQLLCELYVQMALHRIDWLPLITQALIEHWLDDALFADQATSKPASSDGEDSVASGSEELESKADMVARYTHQALGQLSIVSGVHDENGVLSRTCAQLFPHESAPTPKFRFFLQNVMYMSTYASSAAQDLWTLIIDRLLNLDVSVDRRLAELDEQQSSAGAVIFDMDEDPVEAMRRAALDKLDLCMNDVLCFIERVANAHISVDGRVVGLDWLLEKTEPSLHRHVLFTHQARHVPFIWMVMVHDNKALCSRLLDGLWQLVLSPDLVTVRQSHAALCFMASLVARASFVSATEAAKWIGVWMSFAWQHHNECLADGRTTEGQLVHGTFYALCHAVMLVFVHRCKQLTGHKQVGLGAIRQWHFDRLTHSQLNPLRYVHPSVVAAFASICRSMQLAYCQHIIDNNRRLDLTCVSGRPVPFEPTFPFEPYKLPTTAAFVTSMYHEFTVLSDTDAQMTAAEDRWNEACKQRQRQESACLSDDFLLDDDVAAAPVGSPLTGSLLTDYGTSPGLGKA